MRKVLVWTPIVFLLFLLQSYFWVPTYEEQTRGNPDRLNEYITASIGDAQILNPILSADSASSEINDKVFEGLLDRDKDLNFRGRLASSWEIFEKVYFYVGQAGARDASGLEKAMSVKQLIENKILEQKKQAGFEKSPLSLIEKIQVYPSQTRTVPYSYPDASGKMATVKLTVKAPARIQMTLSEVEQDFFPRMETILGEGYFSRFDPASCVSGIPEHLKENAKQIASEVLPATEHNPVIVFHLRKGVTFHDGEPFDAEDVKFTYDAIMNTKNISPRVSDYEPVKSVEIMDSHTVRIIYKRLFSPAVGTWGMGILPSHLLNEAALKEEARQRGLEAEQFSMRQSRFNRNPIGCGPFRFERWESDQFIVLERFENYWEGAPNYKTFTYRIIPDPLTQEMEFYAGTVDDYSVQPHQVERLKDDPRYQSFSGLSFAYSYIGYNMRREPFDDRRVRTALGMAIDVEKIIRYVLYDQGEQITGPFLKQTDFFNTDVKPLPHDPEGAVALLNEAGFKMGGDGWLKKDGKPLQFTLITNQGNEIRQAILSIAQDSWRKIGVDVRTDVLEWAVFIQERVNKLDFDALVLGWSMGIDPDLFQIWHSSQTGPNQLNFVGFSDPEADKLIIDIRQEYNHKRQVALCHRLHEIIAHAQPYTFLYAGKWTAVLDKRIVIKQVDDRGNVSYRPIEPTKTGNYSFYFNKWVKLPEAPNFTTRK